MLSNSIQKIEEKIINLAEKDKNFRKELITNPKKAIKEKLNISIPDGIEIKVVEDTDSLYHFVLPPAADQASDEGARW